MKFKYLMNKLIIKSKIKQFVNFSFIIEIIQKKLNLSYLLALPAHFFEFLLHLNSHSISYLHA